MSLAEVDALGLDRAKGDARRVLARMLAVEPDWLNAARRGEAYAPICTLAWSGDLAGARTLLGARESVWRRLQAFSASTGRAARTTALARGLACAGRDADALKELEALVREGYHAGGWRGLRADHAYDAIRGTPRFVALVERLRTIADGEQKRLRERQDLNESDITALTEVRVR